MNFNISLTVPIVQKVSILPNNQIYIYSNAGTPIQTTFEINGIMYQITNCDLSNYKTQVINTTCDLLELPAT